MLVIKTQTLSLETNNDIIKIKDEIKQLEEYKNSSNQLDDIDNGFNLMKTMMNISKLDIDNEQHSSLNILNNVEDLNDINDINDIKDSILQELSKQNIETKEDVIEISEN
jgi:hypothetical protein